MQSHLRCLPFTFRLVINCQEFGFTSNKYSRTTLNYIKLLQIKTPVTSSPPCNMTSSSLLCWFFCLTFPPQMHLHLYPLTLSWVQGSDPCVLPHWGPIASGFQSVGQWEATAGDWRAGERSKYFFLCSYIRQQHLSGASTLLEIELLLGSPSSGLQPSTWLRNMVPKTWRIMGSWGPPLPLLVPFILHAPL